MRSEGRGLIVPSAATATPTDGTDALILPGVFIYIPRKYLGNLMALNYSVATEMVIDSFLYLTIGPYLAAQIESLALDCAKAVEKSLTLFVRGLDRGQLVLNHDDATECLLRWKKIRQIWDSGKLLDEAVELFMIKYHHDILIHNIACLPWGEEAPTQAEISEFVQRVAKDIHAELIPGSVHFHANLMMESLLRNVKNDRKAAMINLLKASDVAFDDIDIETLSYLDLRQAFAQHPEKYDRDYRFSELSAGRQVPSIGRMSRGKRAIKENTFGRHFQGDFMGFGSDNGMLVFPNAQYPPGKRPEDIAMRRESRTERMKFMADSLDYGDYILMKVLNLLSLDTIDCLFARPAEQAFPSAVTQCMLACLSHMAERCSEIARPLARAGLRSLGHFRLLFNVIRSTRIGNGGAVEVRRDCLNDLLGVVDEIRQDLRVWEHAAYVYQLCEKADFTN